MCTLIIVISSCATAPVARHTETQVIRTHAPIVLLTPIVQYKDIQNDYRDVIGDYSWLENHLQTMSIELLSNKGFNISNNDTVNALVAQRARNDATFDIYRDIHGSQADAVVHQLHDIIGNAYLLVIKTVVYKGPRGMWNPTNGAMTSAANRTQVRAKLVDLSSSTIVWRNEAQYNDIPDQKDENFNQMISLLYSTISQ
jgi:hypothetical protein